MSVFSCLDGLVYCAGFSTLCSACNVARSCVQCSCFSVDCVDKICNREKKAQQLKLEFIEGNKYIDLTTGDTITVQIFAKPIIEALPI